MTEQLNDHDLHRKTALASLATRTFIVFVGVALTLLLGTTAVIVSQIRHQQVQSRGTLVSANTAARNAQITADAIHSCVTPGLPCFQRAQRRTADAVSNINRVVILAAACAVDLPPDLSIVQRQTQIQSCVISGLSRENARK